MSHYYSKTQEGRSEIKKIGVAVFNQVFEIYSDKGIFSKDYLDNGSSLLIENAVIKDNDKVLDLGCGNGVIGVMLSQRYDIHLTMSDVNQRAVKIADMNIKLFGIKNAKAVQGDMFENIKEEEFDTILLNPPQTAGKSVCFKMIEESAKHLKKGGLFQLVARHKKGGATLEKHMEEVFGNVHQTEKKSGFRIYASEKQ